jgi:2-polyprenyl-3-methyl-5-hydroxy-6-metoxy-1,4-benzoquinol methylase
MPKADRMGRPICFVEHELAAFRGDRLGPESNFDRKQDTILDVGCGGGRTVSKLAAIATQGTVYGLDYSAESVAVAERTNRLWIGICGIGRKPPRSDS